MILKDPQFNMIEQQVRPWEVLDQRTLELIASLPRADFVPLGYQALAYADIEIPLGHGQAMMRPIIEGRMLQALDLHPTDKGLEIGTGSGYVTALLARSIHRLTSVEIFEDLSHQAGERLRSHDIGNVDLVVGDAAQGWDGGPYDVIAVTGSVPVLPEAFRTALNRGGRLFVVVGRSPVMEALLITRIGDDEWHEEALFETELAPLVNVPVPASFEF